jgi:hypothetical protein
MMAKAPLKSLNPLSPKAPSPERTPSGRMLASQTAMYMHKKYTFQTTVDPSWFPDHQHQHGWQTLSRLLVSVQLSCLMYLKITAYIESKSMLHTSSLVSSPLS